MLCYTQDDANAEGGMYSLLFSQSIDPKRRRTKPMNNQNDLEKEKKNIAFTLTIFSALTMLNAY